MLHKLLKKNNPTTSNAIKKEVSQKNLVKS
jgi:hypothetical protein